jgi:polysaccharide deacetylase family protein (PEP-CTERM system associated)
MESRVEHSTRRLLDLFDQFQVRSTFFVLGWVGERHPTLVKEIADRGHEVACHGYAHRLVYDQTPATFRADVSSAKRILEDASGTRVVGYRAPSYSITPRSLWAIDVLLEEGFRYDASIFPIRHDRYGIPISARHPYSIKRMETTIVEVPGSTTRIAGINLPVAGGGYFRIFPYAWAKWGITRVNQLEHRPVVFYLHPWEIDSEQPRLPIGMLGRFRHYRHLADTEARLRRLLGDFSFSTVASLLEQSSQAPISLDSFTTPLPYAW